MSASAAGVPPVPVTIRALAPEDLPAVVRIEAESYSVPWSEKTFGSLTQRSDTDLLCAVARGEVIGYAVSWYVADQAELGNVAVASRWRGQGVGTTLVEAMLERCRQRRAREVLLEVRESNTSAQRLYRRLGFRRIGVRRRYYVKPVEDALLMRLRIE